MQTGYPAREIAKERLDWCTYDIEPDGTQISAIRGRSHDDLVLDRRTSQLFNFC